MECIICLQSIINDVNVIELTCCSRPRYHKLCWLRWSVENSHCALCRRYHENSEKDKNFVNLVKKSRKTMYNNHFSKINMKYVLIKSIQSKNIDNIKLIMKYKDTDEFFLNLNGFDERGFTIMHNMIMYGKLYVLKYFIENFGHNLLEKPTYNTLFTPLHFAVIFKKYQMVKFLLKCGANVNKINAEAKDAIHLAFMYDCSDLMIKLLLNNVKDDLHKVDIMNKTYLDYALRFNRKNISNYMCKCK